MTALTAALLFGCAAPPKTGEIDPVSDFIVVAELEAIEAARFRSQFNARRLADRYALLESRGDHYLVRFRRRCHAFYEDVFPPDVRFDRNTLRAGIDTIRGCRIDQIFTIDEAQAEELELLGKRSEHE